MVKAVNRPLSPHLSIWRWGPAMLISILHRISGNGLAIVGGLLFTWWLVALAGGQESYDIFYSWVWAAGAEASGVQIVANWLGRIVLVGLTWAFFQHFLSGLRHFVLDIGAGYDVETNNRWSSIIVVLGIVLTAIFWAFALLI